MNPIHKPTSIAKLIDHAVLHPAATEAEILAGCRLSVEREVAAYCVNSNAVALARDALGGSDVALAAVVGFPHGNTLNDIKRTETRLAIEQGAEEIDMVVNIGHVRDEAWEAVADDIHSVNDLVVSMGASLKVIFETGYLSDDHIIQLSEICGEIGVDYIKTSTGFGYVKAADGGLAATGATVHHVRLMRKHAPGTTGIKASGGIRTLDDLLAMVEAGANRIGTSATETILDEAKRRGL